MQKLHSLALLALTMSTVARGQSDDPVPNPPVPVAVRDVFVPVGFDSNDEVEVVLDGYLPDTCYKLAFSRVELDDATKTFVVRQYARKVLGVCFETPVPFTTEVALGQVKIGEYTVASRGGEAQPLEVNAAIHDGPDDFMYAPIDAVRVEKAPDGKRLQAVIEGRFTSSCMQFAELRLIDSGRTLQLLPIIVLLQQDDCRIVERPFREIVALPRGMTSGRHLLHVRSLNGKAQNTVFTVD